MERLSARRCSVCNAVKIGDEYFAWVDGLDTVYDFSDTIFSEKCAEKHYGAKPKGLEFELEECPKK
ncbi:hypothetical protein HNV12_01960 [Methanococcoides sp. SA1]|nr:hypothetical protein [Methanococcoides sp. SA1]